MFTAFLVVALVEIRCGARCAESNMGNPVFPFALGGAIAFVTNVPMSFLEKKILGRVKENNKIVVKSCETDKSASYNYIGGWCNRTGNVRCDSTAYADHGKPDDEYCQILFHRCKAGFGKFSHDNQDIMKAGRSAAV